MGEEQRTFTETEIRVAIENYRQQYATVIEQIEAQKKLAETTLAMLNGAIVAFESLLNLPVPGPPEPPDEN